MKVAFLDRDGTIIEDYEDEHWRYITEPVFLEGAINALKEIRKKGYEIIIITNQYLIDENVISLEQYQSITDQFVRKIKDNNIDILDVFYCPHSREANCECMKPKDGMIRQALEKYPNIKLPDCFIAGDSLNDVRLGESLGIRTFGIGVGLSRENTVTVASLADVVKYI